MATLHSFKSEVEVNASKLIVGDILNYFDNANSQAWEITELFEGGFEAKDLDKDCPARHKMQDFYFADLQIGWEISNKTKKQNFTNFRLTYN